MMKKLTSNLVDDGLDLFSNSKQVVLNGIALLFLVCCLLFFFGYCIELDQLRSNDPNIKRIHVVMSHDVANHLTVKKVQKQFQELSQFISTDLDGSGAYLFDEQKFGDTVGKSEGAMDLAHKIAINSNTRRFTVTQADGLKQEFSAPSVSNKEKLEILYYEYQAQSFIGNIEIIFLNDQAIYAIDTQNYSLPV